MTFGPRVIKDLEADLSGRAIKSFKGFAYIESHVVIDGLNRIFGYGQWDTDVVEHRVLDCSQRKQGNGRTGWAVTWYALVRLTVRSEGGDVAHYTDASCATAFNPNVGDAYEQSCKSAISGALKRTARHLGRQFGLSLYGDLPPADYTPSGIPKPEPAQAKRPESDAKADGINQARRHLRAVVETAARGAVDLTRANKAVKAKLGKPTPMCTEADYREVAGIVRGIGEAGNMAEWCTMVLGDGDAPAIDAEAVEPAEPPAEPGVDPNEAYRKGTMRAFSECWADYCRNHDINDERGVESRIIADMIRAESGLPADAPWSSVLVAELRSATKAMQYDGGALVKLGIAVEWRDAARARGLDV